MVPRAALPLLVLLLPYVLPSAVGAEQGYGELHNELMEAAQNAGKYYGAGKKKKAFKEVDRAKQLFEKATTVDPLDPQVHLTYGTLLLNANKLDEAEEVWKGAQLLLTPELLQDNPTLEKYVEGRIRYCRYGKVSMLKDETYAGGSGNIPKTLELQGEQLALRPLPHTYHDRATVKVMYSAAEPSMAASAQEDFRTAQKEAIRGYLKGKEAVGKRCTSDSGLKDYPHDADPDVPDEFTSTIKFAEGDQRSYRYRYPAALVAQVENALVTGPDAVVTSDTCKADRWTQKVVKERLAAFYQKLQQSEHVRQAGEVARQFALQPEVLLEGLLDKYGKKPEVEEGDFDWLREWAADTAAGCVCSVFVPSQTWRVDIGRNIPNADVYGEHSEAEWVVQPRRPQAVIPSAVLLAQFAGSSFFHFVAEVLPRYLLAENTPDTLSRSAAVLVPADRSSNGFVAQFFELLGADTSTFRPYTGDVLVTKLFVPTWIPDTEFPNAVAPPHLLRKLRSRLLSGSSSPRASPVVLFLDRKTTSMRKLENADAVYEAVERAAGARGYRAVRHTQPLSARDTRNLFSRAAAVVAVHGGAMANTIFCPEGTLVFELGFDTIFAFDFVHFSSALGFRHFIHPVTKTPMGMGAPNVTLPNVSDLEHQLIEHLLQQDGPAEEEL